MPDPRLPASAGPGSGAGPTLRALLVDPWTHWDGEWYRRIAVDGYTNLPVDETGQRDIAFFPLSPLAVRSLATVVGDVDVASLLVSNAAPLATLILLYRLVRRHSEPAIARGAILLLAFFPFSYFLGAMYSESLFLLAAGCALTFAEQERWPAAGLCGALAGMTRVTGALIAPALLLLFWSDGCSICGGAGGTWHGPWRRCSARRCTPRISRCALGMRFCSSRASTSRGGARGSTW